jgi:hypothetical protein
MIIFNLVTVRLAFDFLEPVERTKAVRLRSKGFFWCPALRFERRFHFFGVPRRLRK